MIVKVNRSAIRSEQLSELILRCRAAGAAAITAVPASQEAVLFYKNPFSIQELREAEFDEVHIQAGRRAVILVAVFLEAGV